MINFQSGIVKVMSQTCFAALALSLTACGGGGGDGSSSSGAGGGSNGGGQQTTSASLSGVPTSISVEKSEHAEADVVPDAEFSVTVTGTPVEPTNFRLVGPDANHFQVIGTFKSTSNTQVFDVEVDVEPLNELDFENPVDEGQDSTYEFDVVFTYDGRTYSFPVTYSVMNEEEIFQVNSAQLFFAGGQKLSVTPDVTGDGKEDLIWIGNRSAQFLASQVFDGSIAGFSWPFFSFVFLNSSHETEDVNVSSSQDGEKIQVLVSGHNSRLAAFYHWDLNELQNLDWHSVANNSLLTDAVVYQAASVNEAALSGEGTTTVTAYRLAEDIDGDEIKEIFYVEADQFVAQGDNPTTHFGLLWGVDSPEGLYEYTAKNKFVFDGTTLPTSHSAIWESLEVKSFPDLDGDGHSELIFSTPRLSTPKGEASSGAIWIIKSASLFDRNASSTKVFNLDDLSTDEGIFITGKPTSGDVNEVRFGHDVQVIDGLLPLNEPALVVSDYASLWVISADVLSNISGSVDGNALLAAGATRFLPEEEGDLFLTTINGDHDFDGDGIVDFVGSTAPKSSYEIEFDQDSVLLQVISGAQFSSRMLVGGEVQIPKSAYRNVVFPWNVEEQRFASAVEAVILDGIDMVGASVGAAMIFIPFTDIQTLMTSTEGVMEVTLQ